MSTVQFDADLIRRYDTAGPRYTSYPTAVAFGAFTEDEYKAHAYLSNEDPIPLPLSLYFHIPFCDTVCFYCACNKIVTKDRSLSAQWEHTVLVTDTGYEIMTLSAACRPKPDWIR